MDTVQIVAIMFFMAHSFLKILETLVTDRFEILTKRFFDLVHKSILRIPLLFVEVA
jgi:hypothetical protein